jgi:transcriptional regulator with XRE-family HTH domain
MIKTEKAYRDALKAIEIMENDELAKEERRWVSKGASPEALKVILGPMRAKLADLKLEVDIFERNRAGDLSRFDDLADVGFALIGARLARGLSQRELAERLEVHESQVSRDERHEYQGITVDRLRTLCDVLEVDVNPFVRLRPSVVNFSASEPQTEQKQLYSVDPARSPMYSGWQDFKLPTDRLRIQKWAAAAYLSTLDESVGDFLGRTEDYSNAARASVSRMGVFFDFRVDDRTTTGTTTGPSGPFVYKAMHQAA